MNWEHRKCLSHSGKVPWYQIHRYQITKSLSRKSYSLMGIWHTEWQSKITFSTPTFIFSPLNLRTVSDGYGVIFHQNITRMKKSYQCKWNRNMTVDFYWILLRDIPDTKHSREKKPSLLIVCCTVRCMYGIVQVSSMLCIYAAFVLCLYHR